MNTLTLEIENIRSKMGLPILNESAIPPEFIIRITKYFDDLVNGKYLDELLDLKKISKSEKEWLEKNASSITQKGKQLVDPSEIINDDILSTFYKIIRKPVFDYTTLKKLSDNAIKLYLDKHPQYESISNKVMDTIEGLLERYKSGENIGNAPAFNSLVTKKDKKLSQYFREQLDLNPNFVDDKELLDYLQKEFEKDPRFIHADDVIKGDVSKNITDVAKELADQGLDNVEVDWATRHFFNTFPNTYSILKSGLGTLDPKVAENEALKAMDALVKKVESETPKNPLESDEEFYNLMLKLKSDIIQAQTKDKKFDEIWEELKLNLTPEIASKLESFEGGSFESIKKYLELENKILKSPKLYNIFSKKFNDKQRKELWNKLISFEKPKVDFKKALPVLNNLITRTIVRSIQWMTKSKFFNYLFWENLSSMKNITEKLARGGVRNGLFWKNLILTYSKMVVVSYMLQPLTSLINNVYLKLQDVFGFVVTDDERTIWEKTADESLEAATFGLYGSDEDVAKNLGLLFNPFGKGFLMDLSIKTLKWVLGINFTYKGGEKELVQKLENEFNKIEEGKKILENIKKIKPEDAIKRAAFTDEINRNFEYYNLTNEQKNLFIKFTTIENGNLIYKKISPTEVQGYPIYYLKGNELEPGTLQVYYWGTNNKDKKPLKDIFLTNESTMKGLKMILEEKDGKKFGDDNFKHWKDTFQFQSADEKNPGQYKDVNIKMEDVMDRIDHYRKKYDEDDAFVRAVVDTHEDVVRIMFTKDLAHIHEGNQLKGLALVLMESRGEKEVWSVARPASGNWFLVKGDFNQKQLANMNLQKKEPRDKNVEKKDSPLNSLKKKEETIINSLKSNEKEDIESLPTKVKQKLKEKLSNGWTTETPIKIFNHYYDKSDVNSVFNGKIEIFKLKPSSEFFNDLERNSARINIKRGFCKSLVNVKKGSELTGSQERVVTHFINKCKTKYDNKFGVPQRDLN